MTGFGLVLNKGSFEMPVTIKPMTISGTMNLLLNKKKKHMKRAYYNLMSRFIKIMTD